MSGVSINLIYEAISRAAQEGAECPTNDELADYAGCSVSMVYKRIKQLVTSKMIVVEVQGCRRRIRVGRNWTKFRVPIVPDMPIKATRDIENRPAECRALIDLFSRRFGPIQVFENVRLKRTTPRTVQVPLQHSCGGYAQYGV